MGLEIENRGDAQIVKVDSRLVSAGDVRELVGAVERGITSGVRKFVIDMSGADWINSAGISALINAYRKAQDVEGNLVLSKVSAKVEQILIITKLARVLRHFPTTEEAITELN